MKTLGTVLTISAALIVTACATNSEQPRIRVVGVHGSELQQVVPRYVKKFDLCSGIGEGEAEGVTVENEYRLEHGLPVRTYYKSAKDDYIPPAWLDPHVKKQRERDAEKKSGGRLSDDHS